MTRPNATFEADRLEIRATGWSLVQPRPDRPILRFLDADNVPWADLLPLAAADTLEGPDEWHAVGAPEIEGRADDVLVRFPVTSARWPSAQLVLRATADRLAVRLELRGEGRLTDLRILGGRATAWPRLGTGRLWSGRLFDRLVPGGPADPAVIEADAGLAAAVGVVGGGQPGRGRWFFTPGPLGFAAARRGGDRWLSIGVAVDGVDEATFIQVGYEADDNGFDLRLEYEGHTRVDGAWQSPWIELTPGFADPYAALAASGARRRTTASTIGPEAPPVPSWWLEPMFCGWGAQVAAARAETRRALGDVELDASGSAAGPWVAGFVPAPSLATQPRYDAWLARLEAGGVIPGTIVIDDKWQRTYGRNEPDEAKWPDLAAWIEARHARNQRVLLWWKAWDAEGLPADWTIRDALGHPVAADPTNAAYAAALTADIERLLRPRTDGGLGADGLKIDFTGASPSGTGLRAHEDGAWGIALLHRLLAIVATAARTHRPDALLVTHTPNPLFADVTSMIRLNDALRLDDRDPLVPVIGQLRHRAAIAAAALPGVPIDTDDWAMPSLAEWREWQRVKPEVGVPALYHVEALGTTPELLTDDDLALVAAAWSSYRSATGLPPRP